MKEFIKDILLIAKANKINSKYLTTSLKLFRLIELNIVDIELVIVFS